MKLTLARYQVAHLTSDGAVELWWMKRADVTYFLDLHAWPRDRDVTFADPPGAPERRPPFALVSLPPGLDAAEALREVRDRALVLEVRATLPWPLGYIVKVILKPVTTRQRGRWLVGRVIDRCVWSVTSATGQAPVTTWRYLVCVPRGGVEETAPET